MQMRGRWILLWPMCLAAALLLTGCMFRASFEELYEMPRLPNEYTELREQIDSILNSGAEYATPTSGTNIQSVQLVDLDGDGTEEALAFFRSSGEERPLKIYIFQAVEGSYEQVALVEGSGTAIHSIAYTDMDGDGIQELIVGWRVNAESQAVGVYSIRNFEPRLLMESLYTQYEVLDFDGDGVQEMVLLRSDDTDGTPIAAYYEWSGGVLQTHSIARLSMTMAELDRVDVGTLRGGETALFVTGVAEDTQAITDILTYYQDAITNIVRNDITGVSSEIFRYIDLQPQDIDGDGVTEVPMPVQLPAASSVYADTYWQVYWRNYNVRGQGELAASTYHNTGDGWYLMLPESWDGQIAVQQTYGSDERGIIFSHIGTEEPAFQEFLGIYAITGSSREYKAARSDRFVLQRGVDTIYAAAFLEGNAAWQYAIDQEELTQRFRLIVREWDPGEN